MSFLDKLRHLKSIRQQRKYRMTNTLGSNVTIAPGAVVGAGAMVTKDVPAYAIVVGGAAKIVKYRFSEDVNRTLLEIKWWDLDRCVIKKNVYLFQGALDEQKLMVLASVSK